MNDEDGLAASHGVERAASYWSEALPATHSLQQALDARVDHSGSLSFQDFMQLALYHPEWGYYARAPRIGRKGDFYTSVSVGPLFGTLLASRLAAWWRRTGSPSSWRVLECGAHDGTLADDFLAALRTVQPDAFEALEYVILEPLPRLQALQRSKLAAYQQTLSWVVGVGTLVSEAKPSVVLGNELIDALPVSVIAVRDGRWREQRVARDSSGEWAWRDGGEVEPEGLPEARRLPEGYRTEVRVGLKNFLRPFTAVMSRGMMLWIDYGFAAPEYYSPARAEGTLRTFYQHRAGADPFRHLGECDITAHVDFTALARAGQELGLQVGTFRSQGSYLTELARDWLLQHHDGLSAQATRAFQSLTHPAHLGAKFHVLELIWNDPMASVASPIEFERLALDFRSP